MHRVYASIVAIFMLAGACSLPLSDLIDTQDPLEAPAVASEPDSQVPSDTATPDSPNRVERTATPEPGFQPTATYYQSPTPTEITEYTYEILDIRTETAPVQGGVSVRVFGVARNDTSTPLDTARVQLRVYVNDELIQRSPATEGYTYAVLPGETITFIGGNVIPGPPEEYELEWTVHGEPYESYGDSSIYRELEITSATTRSENNFTTVDVRVKNTGDLYAYPYLHYAFFDANDQLIDAAFIGVDGPGLTASGIPPGEVGAVTIYGPESSVNHQLFLVAMGNPE